MRPLSVRPIEDSKHRSRDRSCQTSRPIAMSEIRLSETLCARRIAQATKEAHLFQSSASLISRNSSASSRKSDHHHRSLHPAKTATSATICSRVWKISTRTTTLVVFLFLWYGCRRLRCAWWKYILLDSPTTHIVICHRWLWGFIWFLYFIVVL